MLCPHSWTDVNVQFIAVCITLIFSLSLHSCPPPLSLFDWKFFFHSNTHFPLSMETLNRFSDILHVNTSNHTLSQEILISNTTEDIFLLYPTQKPIFFRHASYDFRTENHPGCSPPPSRIFFSFNDIFLECKVIDNNAPCGLSNLLGLVFFL